MCLDEKEKDISSELGIAALALTAEDYASSVQRSDDNDGGGTSRHTMTDAAAINLAERSPRFEDASGHANVTVQLGDTAFLNCKVLDLQDKTVKPSASLFTYMIDFCFYNLIDCTFAAGVVGATSRTRTSFADSRHANVQHRFAIFASFPTPQRLATANQVRSAS